MNDLSNLWSFLRGNEDVRLHIFWSVPDRSFVAELYRQLPTGVDQVALRGFGGTPEDAISMIDGLVVSRIFNGGTI